MSHITEIKTKYRDLAALAEAADLLGGEFVENQKTHAWYGRFVGDSEEGRQFALERGTASMGKCDHAIRIKNAVAGDYEVGVVKDLDGDGFSLTFDSWGPGARLARQFGDGMSKLKQEYAAAVATKKAKAKLARLGFSIGRENLASGAIKIRLRKR